MTEPSIPVIESTNPFTSGDFWRFWVARITSMGGQQIMTAALAWQVYVEAREHHGVGESAFLLGIVGLAKLVPKFVLTLMAGEVADRRNRKHVMAGCLGALAVCAALFLGLSLLPSAPFSALLLVSALYGACHAFHAPGVHALLPMLVPRPALARALAANSLAGQIAKVAGPAVGGVLAGFSVPLAHVVALVLFTLGMCLALTIRRDTQPAPRPTATTRRAAVGEGLAYVRKNPAVLGALSLDMVAVVLGGTALLIPVFARDVLDVGAEGYGFLRSAMAIGAVGTALFLSRWTISYRNGRAMLIAVGIYGASITLFGLSTSYWFSVAALICAGAADMVSVNVRQTLVQLATPDHLRGRVSSVSSLFTSSANELAEIESGVMTLFIGPVGAILVGGVGSMAAAGIWAWKFPVLRGRRASLSPADCG